MKQANSQELTKDNTGLGKVQFWVPDLVSFTGGIQTFCQHFLEAAAMETPNSRMTVLVKNDPVQMLRQQGLPYSVNGSGQWWGHWRTLHYSLMCAWVAWREKPVLIVCMHLHFSPLALLLYKLLRIRYVILAYGIEVWHNNSSWRRRALQETDLVLAISNFTRDYLLQNESLDSENVKLLAPTYNPRIFSVGSRSQRLSQRYNLTPQMRVIFTVCRLAEEERYKGYDQIIRALPQVLNAQPGTRYILAGKGPDLPRIQKLIKEMGVEHAVTLVGFVPDEELAEHYNLCDVFAMPSKAEGFGIVYLEALSCGKPVLAGNRDGSRDAVANGELGVLIDPDNIDEIAENLIQILQGTHPHPLIYQPEELRKRVIEKFGFESFQKKVQQYLAPYLKD